MAATPITKNISSLLCYTVIIAFLASLVLSVDAIRCHQCNSHLDEDCVSLRLSTPRAPPDNQYLRECQVMDPTQQPFCRKTTFSIDVTGEHRIVRSCGWHKEGDSQVKCLNADAEGLKQSICTCFQDGCNAAPPRLGGGNQAVIFGLAGFCVLFASVLRRSG